VGSPDCTWYAWQRLHDALGVDMQQTGNAGDWATLALQPTAFWWEAGHTYVPVQVNPALSAAPSPGDLVVYPDAVAGWANPYHVAFVEDVEGNLYQISEQSYQDFSPGPKTVPYPYVNHRWVSLAATRQEEPHASFLHFGAPIGDDARYVAESRYPTVEPGQAFTISFTERNEGFHSWSDAGKFALVCTANCMHATSGGFNGVSVASGQQFQFTIWLTAPMTPGLYHSQWEMRQDGRPFGNKGMFMAVNVAHDGSRWQPEPETLSARPGQILVASMTFTNTGKTTWTASSGYALACDSSDFGTSPCPEGFANGLIGQQQVAPGQSIVFTVFVVAPSTAGTSYTCWDMHHNGVAFGDTSGHLDIVVGDGDG
jgi:surface antigen